MNSNIPKFYCYEKMKEEQRRKNNMFISLKNPIYEEWNENYLDRFKIDSNTLEREGRERLLILIFLSYVRAKPLSDSKSGENSQRPGFILKFSH